jgi:hypothetical protein
MHGATIKILKPVGFKAVKSASRPNHLAWQRPNSIRKLTAIRQSQQIEIFRLFAPLPPPLHKLHAFQTDISNNT